MLKEMKSLVAFLTIIPVGAGQDCVSDAAKYMHLFPLVGALIGLLAGSFAWLLHSLLDPPLVGVLTVGLLLLLTGLHHADGLLDFGDGLMYRGPPEEKIRVMRDAQTGAGGFALGFVTFLATALCIASLHRGSVVQGLVASEASAKLSMVVMARLGRSACDGMNRPFIHSMRGPRRNARLAIALLIALCTAVPPLGLAGLAAVAAGVLTAAILVKASDRHFGGLTGDVFGAGNELARLGSLLAILAAS